MGVLEFGRALLLVGGCLTGAVFLLSLCGILFRERRLVHAARSGLYVLAAVVISSAACLVYGFVAGEYNNEYIYNYSEKNLPFFFKVAGLWGGLDGSLLFWTMILAIFAAVVGFQHRWSSQHPTGRRLEPYVYVALSFVLGFFVIVSWNENPFSVMDLDTRVRLAASQRNAIDASGNLLDGAGLNPQLVNYWFVIHPPSLYIGFIGFTVPFAFAIAALLAGEVGDYWVRVVRRWTMFAWLFLTSGIILGGLWAYRQLGWGGYWAWDPVENASFLPWCTGTAFLHSVMVQERRDMLKTWNGFLILLTFFLTIWGTWMTRSGVVDSVHAFTTGSNIGLWFQFFMLALGVIGLFLLFYRHRQLASPNTIDSLLSRESVFLLNNMVLIVIATVVLILSFFTKITHDFLASKGTLGAAQYNMLMTPLFALLLFLTAIGPGLGWVRTTSAALKRNFLKPALASFVLLLLCYALWYFTDRLGTWSEVLVPRLTEQHATALYPTGLFLWLVFFILATLWAEFYRTLRARVRLRHEDLASACFHIVVRNNRRWGGYLVHVGMAVLAAGIIISSMFQVKKDLSLGLHESAQVGPYTFTPFELKTESPKPGQPYELTEVAFRISGGDESGLPKAHGAAETPSGEQDVVAILRPEVRFYPKRQESIKEVSIERQLLGDIYIHLNGESQGRFSLTVYLNPLMMLIYLGWFIMVGGGIFAALPVPGSRVGLAE